MKRRIYFYIVFIFSIVFTSCKKDGEIIEETKADQVFTMEIDGDRYKSISVEKFDNVSDTSEWITYSGGAVSINSNKAYNGNGSINFVSDNQCFLIDKTEGVSIKKDSLYVIHFQCKISAPAQIQKEDLTGACLEPFRLELKQGNVAILSEWFKEHDSWTEKYFYFRPVNDAPVKINLMVGANRSIYLDDLSILEKY